MLLTGCDKEEIETDISKIKTNVANMIKESGDLRYDLILEGGYNHAWITEVSSIEEDGSFESMPKKEAVLLRKEKEKFNQ